MTVQLNRKALIAALLAMPSAAWAQGAPAVGGPSELEEVVVTAERRSANLQDVPIAISAVTGDALREAGARDPRDLQQVVPNLQFNQTNAGSQTTIFIRGVGINDTNATTTGAVGVYVDDVFVVANAGKMFNVFDSDGIEVLRGPQGTLYGRNTTGGAIKFVSKKPTEDLSVDLEARYGNYNNIRLEGGVGGALIPGLLAVRVSGLRETRDGLMLNLETGNETNEASPQGLFAKPRFVGQSWNIRHAPPPNGASPQICSLLVISR